MTNEIVRTLEQRLPTTYDWGNMQKDVHLLAEARSLYSTS